MNEQLNFRGERTSSPSTRTGAPTRSTAARPTTRAPGLHELATRSVIAALGIPFYSWIEITLSPEPDPKAEGAYTLIFLNDLEPDRECIRWKTRIA